jgi:uncharacterized membrane-anchored protein
VEKPKVEGGLGVGTTVTSAVLLAMLAAGVAYQIWSMRRSEEGEGAPTVAGQPALATDYARP